MTQSPHNQSLRSKQSIPSFEPQTQPWVLGSNHMGLVPATILDAHFLRSTFSRPWQTELDLPPETRIRFQGQADHWVEAAVLVPFVLRDTGITVMLTKRTAHLHDHAGQVSFPGGRVETFDVNPHATAVRETVEETGLPAHYIDIVGQLPLYRTGTGFNITPVAALIKPGFTLQPDAFEVAEVFEVPLDFLTDPKNYRFHTAQLSDGSIRQYYSVPFQDFFIWGATAAMLRGAYQILAAAFDSAKR
jgi:8-oxo-dGTP pyrophosphatase MutT (NUDIX family)